MPVEDEQFLVDQTRQLKVASKDHLSITSCETYTKENPQVLVQNPTNVRDDSENCHNTHLSMYPLIINTDDDDDDEEYESCVCVSDHDHPVPSTHYQQRTSGTIDCFHHNKHLRRQ